MARPPRAGPVPFGEVDVTSNVTGYVAGYIVRYLGVVGGAAAGLQVVGGAAAGLQVVRGAGAGLRVGRGAAGGVARLVEGEPREALGEVAGGLLAPVASVVNQATLLGAEVCKAAMQIAGAAEPALPPA